MNKEEKLEELKQLLFQDRLTDYGKRQLVEIIEKLQKEINQYKELDKKICNEELLDKNYVLENYISKDKIREKIKELKSIGKYKLDHKDLYLEQESIDLLKELLEEGE